MANKMGFFAARVEDVQRALGMHRRGEKLSAERERDIAWLERTIGLSRPLRSYSARSQRRIFQRLGEGAISQKDINEKERAARKRSVAKSKAEHGMLPKQWKTIEPLRNKLSKYGMDVEPYMDDEVLKDFALLYGYEYLRRVLTQQIDSTEKYLQGDSGPGNARWNARGELEAQFGASVHVQYVRGTNPYYYYHGRRA